MTRRLLPIAPCLSNVKDFHDLGPPHATLELNVLTTLVFQYSRPGQGAGGERGRGAELAET